MGGAVIIIIDKDLEAPLMKIPKSSGDLWFLAKVPVLRTDGKTSVSAVLLLCNKYESNQVYI